MATVPRLLGWPKERIAGARRRAVRADRPRARARCGARYPSQLSGGQRQRVGVARALAADPPLMLMDEPFGAIDPINRAHLQDEFLRLQEQVRKTVVFVTHDVDEAIKMGDRIAILREGGVLAQYDTPAEILRNPADDFVAQFVGADRGIKRLSLLTVGELGLLAPNGAATRGRRPARHLRARRPVGAAEREGRLARGAGRGRQRARRDNPRAAAPHARRRRRHGLMLRRGRRSGDPGICKAQLELRRAEPHVLLELGEPQLGIGAVARAAPARLPRGSRGCDRVRDRAGARAARAPLPGDRAGRRSW